MIIECEHMCIGIFVGMKFIVDNKPYEVVRTSRIRKNGKQVEEFELLECEPT
jgi:translation elongation factor P/translation initiation factor 5A